MRENTYIQTTKGHNKVILWCRFIPIKFQSQIQCQQHSFNLPLNLSHPLNESLNANAYNRHVIIFTNIDIYIDDPITKNRERVGLHP